MIRILPLLAVALKVWMLIDARNKRQEYYWFFIILGIGVTFLLITGNFDMSVGGVVALTGVLSVWFCQGYNVSQNALANGLGSRYRGLQSPNGAALSRVSGRSSRKPRRPGIRAAPSGLGTVEAGSAPGRRCACPGLLSQGPFRAGPRFLCAF